MKYNSFHCLLPVFFLIQLCFPYRVAGEYDEDTWMEPDAWARDHLSLSSLQDDANKCCKCSEEIYEHGSSQPLPKERHKSTEDEVSLMYFKKFVTLLFNRKKLHYDSSLLLYERSLVFTLTPSQLDKLHQLQDPRDLDNILTEILENVRIPNMYRDGHHTLYTTEASGFRALVVDIFHDMWQLTKTSEIRFLLTATLVIIIGWFLNNRYNIGWLTLVFGGLFMYGYLHTYLECNRELEVNQMLEVLNRNKGTSDSQNDSRFVRFLKSIFSGADDSQNLEEKQKLKKSTVKLSLGFCRPDHVVIMYFNDIFLTYLQVLLEQCTNTLKKLKNDLPWPYNYFAAFMLICIVGYILKLTFKYILSPKAWTHLLHRNHYSAPPALGNGGDTASHNGDRISGENLKLLLNAINAVPQRNATSPAVSGVEEVKEAIEAGPLKDSPSPVKKSTSSIQNNNNSNNSCKDGNTEVTLEDLPEES